MADNDLVTTLKLAAIPHSSTNIPLATLLIMAANRIKELSAAE